MATPQFTVTQLEEQFLDMYKDTTEETRADEFYKKCMKLFDDAYRHGHGTGYKKGADKWLEQYVDHLEKENNEKERELKKMRIR